MIFYFTGTGNSGFVAETLSNFLGIERRFIPDFNVEKDGLPVERMLLIFPVYSWGVPPLIEKFLFSIPESHWIGMKESGYNIDCVMTCGDEVALAPEMLSKIMGRVGMVLYSVYSVIMPNNYVLLPGFDVDSKEVEQRKLKECQGRIMEIAQSLAREDRRIDVIRGKFAWFKSRIVFPLFKKWGIFPSKWRSMPTCISCGKCSAICPLLNINMIEGHPEWGRKCCSCLACYHVCPCHAVAYGKETSKKGQYMFPLRKNLSLHYRKR